MGKTNGVEAVPAPEVMSEIRAVVGRAKQGDTTVLPTLRQLLTEHPELWQKYGNLAAHAEAAWAGLVAGENLHMRESLLVQVSALREELAGPSPSPVERLLVERVVMCWMQMAYFDALEAQAAWEEKPRLAAYRAKRQEQAHRMYVTSLAALTTLRRLLPPPAKVVPAVGSEAGTRKTTQHVSGHAPDLPPSILNRISGCYFDEPAGKQKGKKRKPEICGVGTDD